MECKFAIKYGNKRSYLAKVYPRLTSSVQKPEVVEFISSLSNQIWVVQRLPVFCTDEVRRGYTFAKYDRFSPYFIANLRPTQTERDHPTRRDFFVFKSK